MGEGGGGRKEEERKKEKKSRDFDQQIINIQEQLKCILTRLDLTLFVQ